MPVDGDNPLLDEAQRIGELPDESTDEQTRPEPVRSEPNVGSYEGFMSSFGSPQRWAGR